MNDSKIKFDKILFHLLKRGGGEQNQGTMGGPLSARGKMHTLDLTKLIY